LATEQANFYKTLTQSYAETFPEQQQILSSLTSEFQPILQAGPSQEGFAAPETAALRTQAADTTAQGAQQADVALQGKEATMGGGEFGPSGANQQLEAGLLSSAANENANLQENITAADYTTGRQNFDLAAQELGSVATTENPNAVAGVATGAGSAANTTQNDIAAENSAWMAPVFGAIGGLGAAAIGKA
jgi:hypothetical protein